MTKRELRLRAESLRGLLATLCLFAGLTSLWGGAELVWRPDGSIIRLPLGVLEHTPFHDFFIPGLLLAGVVGMANTVAGMVTLRRNALANRAAFVSGGILVTWIVVEMLLLQHVHWLHGVYLVLGLATQIIALVRESRAGRLGTSMRYLARPALHALAGWTLCGATMAALLAATTLATALLLHAVAAPLIFAAVSMSYFRGRAASAPLPTAIAFAVLVALLDLVIVACFVKRSLAMFVSFTGSWLPLLLIFAATWTTGTLLAHQRARRDHSGLPHAAGAR
ncbi:MAG TPA: hypothetical protein VN894_14195 [Polyangiaceae bacterium]|nr:hypothetical protein [Polyangiaceae bacterium]